MLHTQKRRGIRFGSGKTTYHPVNLLLLISALLLQGCDSTEKMAPEAAITATGIQEPLFQPHDWTPKTRDLIGFGDEYAQAIEIAEGIYQTRGTSNVAMVVTDEGNILIDTGLPPLPGKSNEHRRKLDRINNKPITHIILTHAHADHYGGTEDWASDKTDIIVQREFLHNQQYLKDLVPFLMPRNKVFFPEDIPDIPSFALGAAKRFFPIVSPTIVIDSEPYEFTAGDKTFIVFHTPGAEGMDNISLWMPEQKILFTGDVFGHMFGMWPNLTTIRGERARFTRPYIDSLNLILKLKPEMLVPSHFYPVKGAEFIEHITRKTRDAVEFVDNAVIEGMNDGKDVHTLMREIQLPERLQLSEAHGKVSWGVKSIWRAYSGWFDMDSANELYATPISEIYTDLVDLAGGPEDMLERANDYYSQNELEKALYLIAIVESVEQDGDRSNALKLSILEAMKRRGNAENHYEDLFLDHLIQGVEEKL